MGYGLIATPGAVDSHVHLISPELLPAALSGGVTTLITAGFEEPPASMLRLLDATVDWPLNIGLQACARSEDDASLEALLDAGACGFKIHEDYGADPALIDHTLRIAETYDVAVALHTDGLHESAELEDTVAAIDGRTVHAYHVEGSGGGHVPDAIGLVREPNIICSSTTPTVPWGVAAAAEQMPMIVLNHGASFGVADDLALVRDRIHEATMAAEGPLHELGAIAIVNSDSQGMGRMMETVRRTFQLAHVMRAWAGTTLGPDAHDDTARVLRYLAKVTIEPAIAHGIASHVGSLQPGRLADIVLWEPAYFGVKPALVIKGGLAAWAAARRGQRQRRGRRADPLSSGLGWARPLGRCRLGHVRVRSRPGCARPLGGRPPPCRGGRHARPDPHGPRPQPRGAADRGRRHGRHRPPGRSDPRGRSRQRGAAEPPVPAALSCRSRAARGRKVSGSSRTGRG